MKIRLKEVNINIDETIFIISFICLFFKNIRQYFENYFVCFLFIIFHELAHISVASLFGIKLIKLNITVSGLNALLNERKKEGVKWLFIYLAGPISNVVLAILFQSIPMVFSINIALAIINLLPIYPLDGFNILNVILNLVKISNKRIKIIQKITEIMVINLLVIIGIIQFVFLRNLSVILMVFYIFIQTASLRKKRDRGIYQKYYKNITKF